VIRQVTDKEGLLRKVIENYPSEVQLLSDIPAYFKLDIKSHRMPLKLSFKYQSPSTKIHAFASFTSLEPQENPDFQRSGRPKSLLINDYSHYNHISVHENFFTKPFLYVVLLTENCCSVTLTATYPTE